jgi:hypothetical protein
VAVTILSFPIQSHLAQGRSRICRQSSRTLPR